MYGQPRFASLRFGITNLFFLCQVDSTHESHPLAHQTRNSNPHLKASTPAPTIDRANVTVEPYRSFNVSLPLGMHIATDGDGRAVPAPMSTGVAVTSGTVTAKGAAAQTRIQTEPSTFLYIYIYIRAHVDIHI